MRANEMADIYFAGSIRLPVCSRSFFACSRCLASSTALRASSSMEPSILINPGGGSEALFFFCGGFLCTAAPLAAGAGASVRLIPAARHFSSKFAAGSSGRLFAGGSLAGKESRSELSIASELSWALVAGVADCSVRDCLARNKRSASSQISSSAPVGRPRASHSRCACSAIARCSSCMVLSPVSVRKVLGLLDDSELVL